MQCCPEQIYGTDSAGNLRPECDCNEGCECMCTGCICPNWGEEYDGTEDDFMTAEEFARDRASAGLEEP